MFFQNTPNFIKQRGVGGKYAKFFIAIDHPHAFVSEEKKPNFSAFLPKIFFIFQFQKNLDVLRSSKKYPELTFDAVSYAYGSISNGHLHTKFGPISKPTFFPSRLQPNFHFFRKIQFSWQSIFRICPLSLKIAHMLEVYESSLPIPEIFELDASVRILSKNESEIFHFFEK